MGEARQSVTIVNRRGLHARASAKFVGAVAELDGRMKGKGFAGTAKIVLSGEGSIMLDSSGARAAGLRYSFSSWAWADRTKRRSQ